MTDKPIVDAQTLDRLLAEEAILNELLKDAAVSDDDYFEVAKTIFRRMPNNSYLNEILASHVLD